MVIHQGDLVWISRDLLGPRLGALTATRIAQVWAGVRLVCEPALVAAP
jgi:hypothetical protein